MYIYVYVYIIITNPLCHFLEKTKTRYGQHMVIL